MSTASPVRVPLTLDQLRWIIGALAVLMAALMLLGFFAASWLENPDGDKLTAWELWIGKDDGEEITMSLSTDAEGGFGDVRFLDRLLILIPLGALLLGALGVNYAFRRFINLSPRTTAIALLVTALILFLLPFVWQMWSTSNWRGDLKDLDFSGDLLDNMLDTFTDTYNTGQQIAFGLIALLAGIAAVALETPRTRAYLNLENPM